MSACATHQPADDCGYERDSDGERDYAEIDANGDGEGQIGGEFGPAAYGARAEARGWNSDSGSGGGYRKTFG